MAPGQRVRGTGDRATVNVRGGIDFEVNIGAKERTPGSPEHRHLFAVVSSAAVSSHLFADPGVKQNNLGGLEGVCRILFEAQFYGAMGSSRSLACTAGAPVSRTNAITSIKVVFMGSLHLVTLVKNGKCGNTLSLNCFSGLEDLRTHTEY